MIVKVENEDGKFVRWDECRDACITEDKDGPKGAFLLICHYLDGSEVIYGLERMSRVYFMNNDGKTIDQDCRMCAPEKV